MEEDRYRWIIRSMRYFAEQQSRYLGTDEIKPKDSEALYDDFGIGELSVESPSPTDCRQKAGFERLCIWKDKKNCGG